LVATTNPGKEREIRRMLAGLGVEVAGLADFPWVPEHEEIGETFAENAAGKALFYHRITGLPTLGDDSGLMVDLLDGGPGVHSARFVGPGGTDLRRIDGLLAAMRCAGGSPRTARFACSVALAADAHIVLAVEGICEGEITAAPRGANGFGFDPVFLVPSLGKTFAELSPDEKNRISHRARALAAFREEFLKLTASAR
jgi:XTP/dITP diphosphohydrolase